MNFFNCRIPIRATNLPLSDSQELLQGLILNSKEKYDNSGQMINRSLIPIIIDCHINVV